MECSSPKIVGRNIFSWDCIEEILVYGEERAKIEPAFKWSLPFIRVQSVFVREYCSTEFADHFLRKWQQTPDFGQQYPHRLELEASFPIINRRANAVNKIIIRTARYSADPVRE